MHSTVVSLVWNNTMSLLWEIKAIFVIKRAIISAIERDCHVNLFISLIWLQEQRIMVNFFVLQHVRCYYQVLLAHVSIASNKESLATSCLQLDKWTRNSTRVNASWQTWQVWPVHASRKKPYISCIHSWPAINLCRAALGGQKGKTLRRLLCEF